MHWIVVPLRRDVHRLHPLPPSRMALQRRGVTAAVVASSTAALATGGAWRCSDASHSQHQKYHKYSHRCSRGVSVLA